MMLRTDNTHKMETSQEERKEMVACSSTQNWQSLRFSCTSPINFVLLILVYT